MSARRVHRSRAAGAGRGGLFVAARAMGFPPNTDAELDEPASWPSVPGRRPGRIHDRHGGRRQPRAIRARHRRPGEDRNDGGRDRSGHEGLAGRDRPRALAVSGGSDRHRGQQPTPRSRRRGTATRHHPAVEPDGLPES